MYCQCYWGKLKLGMCWHIVYCREYPFGKWYTGINCSIFRKELYRLHIFGFDRPRRNYQDRLLRSCWKKGWGTFQLGMNCNLWQLYCTGNSWHHIWGSSIPIHSRNQGTAKGTSMFQPQRSILLHRKYMIQMCWDNPNRGRCNCCIDHSLPQMRWEYTRDSNHFSGDMLTR